MWYWPQMHVTRPYWWQINIGSGNGLEPSGVTRPQKIYLCTALRVDHGAKCLTTPHICHWLMSSWLDEMMWSPSTQITRSRHYMICRYIMVIHHSDACFVIIRAMYLITTWEQSSSQRGSTHYAVPLRVDNSPSTESLKTESCHGTLSSLSGPQDVIMTTCGSASDMIGSIMIALIFKGWPLFSHRQI